MRERMVKIHEISIAFDLPEYETDFASDWPGGNYREQGASMALGRQIEILAKNLVEEGPFSGAENLKVTVDADREPAPSGVAPGGDSLDELDVSVRSANALHRAGKRRVAEIQEMTSGELKGIPGIGPHSAADIQRGIEEWKARRAKGLP